MIDKQSHCRRLSEVPAGTRVIVRLVDGGRALSSRLAAMGVFAGSDVEVLQNSQEGPMLVRARNTRVALGRSEANKVLVEDSER